MNNGRFFELNQYLSRLDKGIAIYDYVALPAYQGLAKDNPMSPKYPLCLVIESDAVCFVMHYCAFKSQSQEGDNTVNGYKYAIENSFKANEDHPLAHTNEVILELPFIENPTKDLTDIVKSTYIANFPQVEAKGVTNKMGSQFLGKLIGDVFPEPKSGETDTPGKSRKSAISYSTLWLMDLVNKENQFDLYDDKTNRDKTNKNKKKLVTKFLRKLLLDFMFDLKHSSVFCTSPDYDRMYNGLMSNFYFSSLMHKCEFYYYRELTIHAIEENESSANSQNQITRLYAQELFKAEELWAEDIRNPLADKFFEQKFPDDYQNRGWLKGRQLTEFCSNVLERMTTTRWDSWFANPEEEMRRIYFEMEEGNGRTTICNSSVLVEHLGLNKSNDDTVKAMTLSARQNRGNTSRWFLNRYDFNDVLHLHLFKFSNGLCVIFAILLLLNLFQFPVPFVEKQDLGLEGLLLFLGRCRKFLVTHWVGALVLLAVLIALDLRFVIKGYMTSKVLKPQWKTIKWNPRKWKLTVENPAKKNPLLKSFRRFRAKRIVLVVWAAVCLLLLCYNLLQTDRFLNWLFPLGITFCWIFLTDQFIEKQEVRICSIIILAVVFGLCCIFNIVVLSTWHIGVWILAVLLTLGGLFLLLNAKLLSLFRGTAKFLAKQSRLNEKLKNFEFVKKVDDFLERGEAYHSKQLGVLRKPYIHPVESWHLLLPKLVASITAAWLTIAMGFDALAAFFDSDVEWPTMIIITVVVFSFILYLIDRELPKSGSWLKVYRAIEMLIISYCLSLIAGVVIINFVGERYLERSGALDDYYQEYVYEHGLAPVIAELSLNDSLIAMPSDTIIDLQALASHERLNVLKHDFSKWKLANNTILLLPHQMKSQSDQLQYSADSVSGLPSAIIQRYSSVKYKHLFCYERGLFIIPNFLMMFSFVAMFIGVFLQMVFFDRKQMTEF